MIVVAIIGLLAAIAIPNFVKARTASQKNACIANLKQIDGAKASWALEQKKNNADTPGDTDLFGATNYIRERNKNPSRSIGQLSLTILFARFRRPVVVRQFRSGTLAEPGASCPRCAALLCSRSRLPESP